MLRLNVKNGFVYILTNKNKTTLYVGVTSDLRYRLWQHKTKFYPNSFSARYELNRLLYFKFFERIDEANKYERYLKGKSRAYKEKLIAEINPGWNDLSELANDVQIF